MFYIPFVFLFIIVIKSRHPLNATATTQWVVTPRYEKCWILDLRMVNLEKKVESLRIMSICNFIHMSACPLLLQEICDCGFNWFKKRNEARRTGRPYVYEIKYTRSLRDGFVSFLEKLVTTKRELPSTLLKFLKNWRKCWLKELQDRTTFLGKFQFCSPSVRICTW